MSVRVNLLPEDVRAKGRANRARLLAGVLGLLLVAALAAVTLLQRQSIGEAEDQLAAVEAENTELQADIVALQPFADLEARATEAADTVTTALGGEASLAGILQDLSAVMPPTTELSDLALTITPDAAAPSPGGGRLIRGTMTATGRVVGIAPGVERLLIDVDRAAVFDNVYVTNAVTDENGVTTFTLEIELGPEVLTERYGVGDETAAAEEAPPPDDVPAVTEPEEGQP